MMKSAFEMTVTELILDISTHVENLPHHYKSLKPVTSGLLYNSENTPNVKC
jgi:hypothetical protein